MPYNVIAYAILSSRSLKGITIESCAYHCSCLTMGRLFQALLAPEIANLVSPPLLTPLLCWAP